MTTALALSGGGARGSFQLGAVRALYEVYGFRPDLISGTSVGSVNAVMLAQAPPPAVNDPAAILAAVAAGTTDPQLRQLRRLQNEWATFLTPGDFFEIHPAFAGTMLDGVVASLGAAPSAGDPLAVTVGDTLDLATAAINAPLLHVAAGVYIGTQLAAIKSLVATALSQNALTTLEPIARRLRTPSKLDTDALAAGTPVWFAMVSLETGRLRYVDGSGRLTERDGVTPVAAALTDEDLDAATDAAGQPIAANRIAMLKDLANRRRQVIASLRALQAERDSGATTVMRRWAVLDEIERQRERGDYLAGALSNLLEGVRVTAHASIVDAVIASAAIPVYFDGPVIAGEHYMDGGVREILPLGILLGRGADRLVGISCSSMQLPATDEMSNAGLPAVALRSLTEVALHEVIAGDIAEAKTSVPSTVVIAPTFDVHGAIQVEPSLMEVSMDYGWLRACDELQPAPEAMRELWRSTSDLIARIRRDSLPFEKTLVAYNPVAASPTLADAQDALAHVRMRAWIVRELLTRRSRDGLPAHPQSAIWWQGWSRELRNGAGPFGAALIWDRQLAPSAGGGMEIGPLVADYTVTGFDGGVLVDTGNDRVDWVVRGAVFRAVNDTEHSTTRRPIALVPHGTASWLPKVPPGRHLMAESDDIASVFVVGGSRRHPATDELIAAAGLTGAEVAVVPPGGLDQIPLSADTSWIGRLAVTDSQRQRVGVWAPTPQEVGTDTTTSIGVSNFTAREARITGVDVVTDDDLAGAPTLRTGAALPVVVPPNGFAWVGMRFAPHDGGSITGTATLTSDDPFTATFSVPVQTAGNAIGPLGLLEVDPVQLLFGSERVAATPTRALTLRNVGTRALDIEAMEIVSDDPAGGFAIPFSWQVQFAAGQSSVLTVSCAPTSAGTHEARLVIDTVATAVSLRQYRRRIEVPLSVVAGAPRTFLAGAPRRRPPRPLGPPVLAPLPTLPGPIIDVAHRLDIELQTLDFGAPEPGQRAERTFWVRNTGDLPLAVHGVTAQPWGFDIPDLSVFPAIVAPGAELAVTVGYLASSTAGAAGTGTLDVLTDDPFRPAARLTLSGRTAGAHVSIGGEMIDLGSGSPPSPGEIVLVSDGSEALAVKVLSVDGDPGFTVTTDPVLPALVPAGQILTVRAEFAGAQGVYAGRVSLAHNGNASGETVLQLRAQVA